MNTHASMTMQRWLLTAWGHFLIHLLITLFAVQPLWEIGQRYHWDPHVLPDMAMRVIERVITFIQPHDVHAETTTPIDEGLQAYLPFDEGRGPLAADRTGNGHDGVLDGAEWEGDGKVDAAVRFDGSDDRVDWGAFDLHGNAMTIALWFKADDFHITDARFVSKATGTHRDEYYWMLGTIRSKGKLRLRGRLRTGDRTRTLAASFGELAAVKWIHAALVYNGSHLKLYQDGRLVGRAPQSGPIGVNADVKVAIGNQPTGAGARAFDGLIDDVRLYNRALSEAELGQLMSFRGGPAEGLLACYHFLEGSGAKVGDVSGVGSPLPLTIADPEHVTWLACGGLSVDAPTRIFSDDAAAKMINGVKASNAITIEAWIAPERTDQSGPARIVTLSTDATNRNFTLGQASDQYDARFRTTRTGKNGANPSTSSRRQTVSADLSHVVYTRDASGRAILYINGLEQGTRRIGGKTVNWSADYRFGLANELDAERAWLGDFYLVAVYDRALSTVEVQQRCAVGAPHLRAPPQIDLHVTPTVGHTPLTVTVDASETVACSSALASVVFDFGDGTTESLESPTLPLTPISHTFTEPGTYTITVTMTDENDNRNVAAETITVVRPGESTRITAGQIALYTFQEGRGQVINDVSGSGAPLNLNIENPVGVNWLACGGLAVNDREPFIATDGAATKIINAVKASNEITLEAWITPFEDMQRISSPARIATLSLDATHSNVTLGQKSGEYDVRLRTTATGDLGNKPSTSTTGGAVRVNELTHVLYTRQADGTARLYVNGEARGQATIPDSVSNWDDTYRFALARELNAEMRFWLGEYHLVSVYDRAFREAEVLQHFQSGLFGISAMQPDASFSAMPTRGNAPLTVAFDASASSDCDGAIASYEWDFGDSASDSGVTATHTYTDAGSFMVTLTVTDNDGRIGRATATITVEEGPPNRPPVVVVDSLEMHEGTELSATLRAIDPDGDAVTLSVSSLPAFAVFTDHRDGTGTIDFKPGFKDAGEYNIEATASAGRLSHSESFTLSVREVNRAPRITSKPVTIATEGQLYTYQVKAEDDDADELAFSLVVAPAGMVIHAETGLIEWTPDKAQGMDRDVTVQVLDQKGGMDEQRFTIAANFAPVVDAGSDQVSTFPGFVTLEGIVKDDGLPTEGTLTIAWSQVSGPGSALFDDATNAATRVRFITIGDYVLRLCATDSELVRCDDVVVSVRPSGPNRRPEVEAGPDQVIGFTDTTTLEGRFSDDGLPFGVALNVDWEQLSGPGTANFSDESSPTSEVSFSATGTYVLELRVSDTALDGADQVTIEVFRDNLPPAVHAGDDVTTSDREFRLSGTVADDGNPAGAQLTVNWEQISGPGAVVFGNANVANTSVTFPQSDVYELQLTASDSEFARSDSVTITVVDNRPPQIISQPVTQVRLFLSQPGPAEPPGFSEILVTPGDVGSNAPERFTTIPTVDTALFGFTGTDVRGANFEYTPEGLPIAQETLVGDEYASIGMTMTFIKADRDRSLIDHKLQLFGDEETITFSAPVVAAGFVYRDSGGIDISFLTPDEQFITTITAVPAGGAERFIGVRVTGDQLIGKMVFHERRNVWVSIDDLIFEVDPNRAATGMYVYDVDATDPDHDPVSFALLRNPDGMTIHPADGLINWRVDASAVGRHEVTVRASDGRGGRDDQVFQVEVTRDRETGPNQPPMVGIREVERDVNEGETLDLIGFVSDDGLPVGVLAFQWSQVEGPGTAEFTNPNDLATQVTFTIPGTYRIELSANDTELSDSDEVEVTVAKLPDPVNQAPRVDAGENQEIGLPVPFVPPAFLPEPPPIAEAFIHDLSVPGLTGAPGGTIFLGVNQDALAADGDSVIVGGSFRFAGSGDDNLEVWSLAKWDGCRWSTFFDPRPLDETKPESGPFGLIHDNGSTMPLDAGRIF